MQAGRGNASLSQYICCKNTTSRRTRDVTWSSSPPALRMNQPTSKPKEDQAEAYFLTGMRQFKFNVVLVLARKVHISPKALHKTEWLSSLDNTLHNMDMVLNSPSSPSVRQLCERRLSLHHPHPKWNKKFREKKITTIDIYKFQNIT